MPRNFALAFGLILHSAMGIVGISTTVLGWTAHQLGIPFTLRATFFLPLIASVVFCFIPYPESPLTSPSR